MQNTLALDTSTHTGWAHTLHPGGVFHLPAAPMGTRFSCFAGWLNTLLDELQTDVIIYEACHHRGGPATRLLLGLTSIVELIAAQRDIEIRTCHTGTLKKFATGSGNAKKYQMREAAEAMCPTIEIADDNHCDALFLLHWSQSN